MKYTPANRYDKRPCTEVSSNNDESHSTKKVLRYSPGISDITSSGVSEKGFAHSGSDDAVHDPVRICGECGIRPSTIPQATQTDEVVVLGVQPPQTIDYFTGEVHDVTLTQWSSVREAANITAPELPTISRLIRRQPDTTENIQPLNASYTTMTPMINDINHAPDPPNPTDTPTATITSLACDVTHQEYTQPTTVITPYVGDTPHLPADTPNGLITEDIHDVVIKSEGSDTDHHLVIDVDCTTTPEFVVRHNTSPSAAWSPTNDVVTDTLLLQTCSMLHRSTGAISDGSSPLQVIPVCKSASGTTPTTTTTTTAVSWTPVIDETPDVVLLESFNTYLNTNSACPCNTVSSSTSPPRYTASAINADFVEIGRAHV